MLQEILGGPSICRDRLRMEACGICPQLIEERQRQEDPRGMTPSKCSHPSIFKIAQVMGAPDKGGNT
jgi:hypothetical protein